MKTNVLNVLKSKEIDTNNIKVILIGVSKYPDDKQVTDVPNIRTNINLLKKTLTNPSILGVNENNFVVSLNKSKIDIEVELTDFVRNTTENDTLIVYYSGHGFISNENFKLYLSTRDSNINHIESTSICIDRFVEIINLSFSKQKIILLDSCHSGYIHDLFNDENSDFYNLNTSEKVYVISSSSVDEPSYYPTESKNSPTYFTGELIDVLTNGTENGKSYLTINEVFNKISRSLKNKNLPVPSKTNLNSNKTVFVHNNYTDFSDFNENSNKSLFTNIFTSISLLVNYFKSDINNQINEL